MTQELTDLRNCILEGRITDALALVDELDGMSKKANIRGIKSYLIRMIIHLVKNQVESRLTNSWAASIRDSLREIKEINLKENKTSYYIQDDEWEGMIDEVIEGAIRDASEEVMNGAYTSFELARIVDREQIIETSLSLLKLTYAHSAKELPIVVDEYLINLVGGEDWKEGRQR